MGDDRGSGAATDPLRERIKELTALHAAAQLMLRDGSQAEQLQAVADLLPPAMQFPSIATGCVRYGAEDYATPGHEATTWTLASTFETSNGTRGEVVVAYRERPPEPIFLVEEHRLIESITEMVRAALERRSSMHQLQIVNDRLALAFATAGMGVWELDVASNVVTWSEQVSDMTGIQSLTSNYKQHADYVHPDDRDYVFARIDRAVDGGDDLRNLSFRFRRGDGSWRPMSASARITRRAPARATRIMIVLIDVSERLALEEGLRHAQKLEALGQVASGVAHDFNNLLAIMLANSDLLCEEVPPEHPWRGLVEDLLSASKRGAALTRQLLAFSRKATFEPAAVDLSDLIAKLEPLLVRIAKKPIKVLFELDRAAPRVWADPVQIEQVVMNLVVNARDAMPGGGTVTVRIHAIGSDVAIEVQDTGSGIDEAVRAKIFEPFFTTKEVGKGTGLGLAVVSSVAKQWQGRVEVDSTLGAGATFRVVLPSHIS